MTNAIIRGLIADLERVARKPRPHEIHVAPCKRCPSAHYPPDPESIDIKETYPRDAQVDSVFACAWRPSKMCRGVADYLDVTEADLVRHESLRRAPRRGP